MRNVKQNMYKTKRMRLKNKAIAGKEHSELAQKAMDSVSEFIADATPNSIPLERLIDLGLRVELLLRWNKQAGNIEEDDIFQIQDAILLREDEGNK